MNNLPISIDNRPETLLDQARHLYNHYSGQTAVVLIEPDYEKSVTYGEFFTEAARYAHALEQAGIRPGDLVAIILQHGESVLYSFWGAMLLGAVPSIFPFLSEKLDRDHYFDSITKLVDNENIRVIITYNELQDDLNDHLSDIDTLAAIINKDTLQAGGDINHYLSMNPAKAEDTAFLQHSSGSTGLQKGVMLSHRAVMNQIASYSETIHLNSDDVIASWLPLYHDMGLIAGFIMPILQGVKLVLMSPFHWIRDPKMLLFALQKHNGTLCWLPNFAYNFLATRIRDNDLQGLDLSSCRSVINCSEPVYATSQNLFIERFTPYGLRDTALATCYAMAENTFAVTQTTINTSPIVDTVDRQSIMDDRRAIPANDGAASQTFVSCGKAIHNCEIKIAGAENNTLPERHVGEIALRSDCMLSGYYNRQDISEEAMQDGWYFSGDMGYMVDGELFITGRKKDLIIVGGKNVYPQDIENLLNNIDGLHPGRTVAFGVFNEKLGTEDVAIIAEVEAEIDPSDRKGTVHIIREIRNRIGQNTDVAAKYVHLVDRKWLHKTSSGKIARNANREKFLQDVLKR
jgi:fatty-acyl-CoA synthase